jgi:hypothetical protein
MADMERTGEIESGMVLRRGIFLFFFSFFRLTTERRKLRGDTTDDLHGLLVIEVFEGVAGFGEMVCVEGADEADFTEAEVIIDEGSEEGTVLIYAKGGFADEASGAEDGLFVAELVLEPEPALAER